MDWAASYPWYVDAGAKYTYKPPPGLSDAEVRDIRKFYDPTPSQWQEPDYKETDWHLPLVDVMDAIGAPPNDFVSTVVSMLHYFALQLTDTIIMWGVVLQNKLLTTPFDDPWWHETMHYYDGSEMIDVPALHVSTWYDPSVLESIDSFNYFREHSVSELAAEHQCVIIKQDCLIFVQEMLQFTQNAVANACRYLILSPTNHCGCSRATQRTIVGERNMGDARLPWYDLCLGWFQHWLHDKPLPPMPKVLYYTMGSNKWQTAPAWPLPNAVSTEFYLHSGGKANSRNGDGILSTEAPLSVHSDTSTSDTFTYDPAHPVPSVGGQRSVGDSIAGAVDQAPVELRADVLCYTTPPLEQGVEASCSYLCLHCTARL